MKIVPADENGLELAAGVLLGGGVAVVPTDTVYGLAAHPAFPDAVRRLYSIKDRAAAKPIALLASDTGAAAGFVGAAAAAVGGAHWPGALTVVANGEGVRVPAHAWLQRLIARCGGALRVTSANVSGGGDATDAEAAFRQVGLSADLTVDGGVSPGGEASSVWKVDAAGIEVLREGPVKL